MLLNRSTTGDAAGRQLSQIRGSYEGMGFSGAFEAHFVVENAHPWPSSLPEQVRALRGALEAAAAPVTADTLTARFKRAQTDRVAELLETLVIVG